MGDLKYEEVEFIPHTALETEVESGDPTRISRALYSASRSEDDWKWAQDQCLRFLNSEHASVRWTAATCLGDLALFKRPIDAVEVLDALAGVRQDKTIADPVEFSIDLLKQFALRIN
jgi:hypothetical protein